MKIIEKQKTLPAKETSYIHKHRLGSGMKQAHIENCLAGWVREHNERHEKWVQVQDVLADPRYLSKFGIALYEKFAETDQREMAKCRRKIGWLLGLHDKKTGRKRHAPKRVDIKELKQRIDCRDLAERYFECKRRGKYAVTSCPFHKERTPSFYAYQDGFKCFGCQWSGDCLNFVQEIEKVDFVTALQKVSAI